MKHLLSCVLLFGCAGEKPAKVMIPHDCIQKVEVTDKTECTIGEDKRVHCFPINLTYRKGCERLNAKPDRK